MQFHAYIDPQQIEKRKRELKRGQTKAFKHALGETVHYWRETYAPRHFTDRAHTLYGHPKSGYGHSQAKSSLGGATISEHGYTLEPPYTLKEVMQVRTGEPPQNLPIVFTGDTRAGILNGQFTVTGSAKQVKGKWFDYRINWRALSARNQQLGRKLVFTPAKEQTAMLKMLDNNFLPKWIAKFNRGEQIPGRLRMVRSAGGTGFSTG